MCVGGVLEVGNALRIGILDNSKGGTFLNVKDDSVSAF